MVAVICKLSWLKNILSDLSDVRTKTALLFCDNQLAMYIANNQVFHERMKQIENNCHLVSDKVQAGEVKMLHMVSQDRLVDLLTKPP